MWVWAATGTRAGLPDDPAVVPTKAQRLRNKKNRKMWDGEKSSKRFRENYKGIQDLLLDFCENKSINELYMFGSTFQWSKEDILAGRVPHEDFWVTFNTEAGKRGIRVWLMFYLWDNRDDPRVARRLDSVLYHAKAVHNFNQAHPKCPFVGIHCDQEPRKAESIVGLLNNMTMAQDWIDEQGAAILVSQALRPGWKNERIDWNGQEKPILEHFIDTIGHAALMCYDNRERILQDWARNLVDYSTKAGKRSSIGFEVNDLHNAWPTAHVETWWKKIQDEPVETRFRGDPADGTVTFEEAMELVNQQQAGKAGYDRMVIHSYNGYFEHWFGLPPRDYVEGLPDGKYRSDAVKPAKVDLSQDDRPRYEAATGARK